MPSALCMKPVLAAFHHRQPRAGQPHKCGYRFAGRHMVALPIQHFGEYSRQEDSFWHNTGTPRYFFPHRMYDLFFSFLFSIQPLLCPPVPSSVWSVLPCQQSGKSNAFSIRCPANRMQREVRPYAVCNQNHRLIFLTQRTDSERKFFLCLPRCLRFVIEAFYVILGNRGL